MEPKIEQLRAKADLLITTFSAHPTKKEIWEITVNFSSYSSQYASMFVHLGGVCIATVSVALFC